MRINNIIYSFKKLLQKLINKINSDSVLSYTFYTILIMALGTCLANLYLNINRSFLFAPSLKKVIDFLIFSMVFYPLYISCKNKKIFFASELLVLFIYYLLNSFKFSILRVPIRFYEFKLIKEIFLTMPIYYGLILVLLIFLSILPFIINFNYKKLKNFSLILIFPIFILLSLMFSFPIEHGIRKTFLDHAYNEKRYYKEFGSFFYLYFDMLKTLNLKYLSTPDKQSVEKAIQLIYSNKISNINKPNRNVILIAVESLTDITKFVDTNEFTSDLFYKNFRKLTNIAKSESVAYTSASSDGIFELLCAFPVLRQSIMYNDNLNKYLPCIPNYFNNFGYKTSFYSADDPKTYNFEINNKKVGFQNSFFINEILKKDKKGIENSLDYQILDFAYNDFKKNYKNNKGFYFVFTGSTHHPYKDYHKNKVEHKIKVNVSNRSERYYYYLNSMYYTTKLLYEFITKIHKIDETAIIVITGDHPAPSLSKKGKGGIEEAREKTIEAFSIPLIVLDGKDNIKVNMLETHYSTAKSIFKLLNITIPLYEYQQDLHNLRFFMDKDRYISIDGIDNTNKQTRKALETIYYDIFYGKQYTNDYFNYIY